MEFSLEDKVDKMSIGMRVDKTYATSGREQVLYPTPSYPTKPEKSGYYNVNLKWFLMNVKDKLKSLYEKYIS